MSNKLKQKDKRKNQLLKYVSKKHTEVNHTLADDLIKSSNKSLDYAHKTLTEEIVKQQRHITRLRYTFVTMFLFITLLLISPYLIVHLNETPTQYIDNYTNNVSQFATYEALNVTTLTTLYQLFTNDARKALSNLKRDRKDIYKHWMHIGKTSSDVLTQEQSDLTKYLVKNKGEQND